MRNKILLIIMMAFTCCPVFAESYVCHTGEVITGFRWSVDPTQAGADCDRILPEDIQIVKEIDVPLKYLKYDNGVVEMSQAEKDAVDLSEAEDQALSIEEAINNFNVSNLEIITALVQRINVRIPSNPIIKAELVQQIKDNR